MRVKSNETTVQLRVESGIATVTLNRPEIHNAINPEMITELTRTIRLLDRDRNVLVVILTGEGQSFCSGADMNWFMDSQEKSYAEIYREGLQYSRLLQTLFSCRVPVIAKLKGYVLAGGVGLASVCDIAVADQATIFSISEVKFGAVPVCIMPYVLRKVGESASRVYILTGARFSAREALGIRLIHKVVRHDQLDTAVLEYARAIAANAPLAVAMSKRLINDVPQMAFPAAIRMTVRELTSLRMTDEFREGVRAFIEKRNPSWKREIS